MPRARCRVSLEVASMHLWDQHRFGVLDLRP